MPKSSSRTPSEPAAAGIYFSDFVGVTRKVVEDYGAFDVSLINDLPLFIDPFLLFHSDKAEYQKLHDEMIRYVAYLKDKSRAGPISDGLLRALFTFKEVKQNWLGYCVEGNVGSGLGMDFARTFNANLEDIFKDFGEERVTRGTHIEKVFITSDVGRDNVSDFVTNVIKDYLCDFTERFARKYMKPEYRRRVAVPKVRFNYATETWESGLYELPWINSDYVILTPLDLLTKDEIWINRRDLIRDYPEIVGSIPNDQLRAQINYYFEKALNEIVERDAEEKRRRSAARLGARRRRGSRRSSEPTQKQNQEAARRTIVQYPGLIDFYIRRKEDTGELAEQLADQQVRASEELYIAQVRALSNLLFRHSNFYRLDGADSDITASRAQELKRVVEDWGGWKTFYTKEQPISKEADLRVIMRLTWLAEPGTSQVTGDSGPTLYKLSDLVRFKLGKNPQLSEAIAEHREVNVSYVTAVLCFSRFEYASVQRIVRALELESDPNIVVIDARRRRDGASPLS